MSDGGASSPPALSPGLDRRVIRGRNICHSARMVCCPISGLGALIWHQAQEVAKTKQTHVCSKLPHTTYLWVWAAALLSLSHLHQSLNMEWGEDEERFLRCRGTGVCAYGACFINLLNSCQVTPIFLSQRKCVASRSRRKSLKKISFLSYLFTSPLAHTILAFFICLIGADIQDSSMCAVFLFAVRGEGKDEA